MVYFTKKYCTGEDRVPGSWGEKKLTLLATMPPSKWFRIKPGSDIAALMSHRLWRAKSPERVHEITTMISDFTSKCLIYCHLMPEENWGENEVERTGKAKIWKADIMAVGESFTANLWSALGLQDRIFNISGSFAQETLISAPVVRLLHYPIAGCEGEILACLQTEIQNSRYLTPLSST